MADELPVTRASGVVRRVCVIGAGSSGIAACQALHGRGIPFDCFEAGSSVGGNWRYGNDNGMSCTYRSLHAKSSRRGMQYAAFPMPDDYPDYLSHEMIARYLDDFVDHFGFRGSIRFRAMVTRVEPAPGGGWDVTARSRDTGATSTGRYGAVLVANGHHWDPRYPEPALPGAGAFAGEQIHSHQYRAPGPFAGKRILVLGIGNSACDVAAECSRHGARTLIAMRAGAHIIPRYLAGRPADHLTLLRAGTKLPLWLRRWAVALLVRLARGDVTRYGLPKPGHRLLCGPLAVSDSLLSGLRRGEIIVKPAIDRFERDRVRFRDGSTEQVDVVIYCTGYKISFPFLRESLIAARDGEIALYRRVVAPALPGLYFIGLVQPIGAIMPVAEAQSQWVADLLEGRAALPPAAEMNREITCYRKAIARRYDRSGGHAIQVDFLPYLREIRKERAAGGRRKVSGLGSLLRARRRGMPGLRVRVRGLGPAAQGLHSWPDWPEDDPQATDDAGDDSQDARDREERPVRAAEVPAHPCGHGRERPVGKHPMISGMLIGPQQPVLARLAAMGSGGLSRAPCGKATQHEHGQKSS